MSDQPESASGGTIAFGPYQLLPAQQLLLDGDKPLRLGSRAFEILKVLIERAGTVVTKDDLIARVWPDTFVEEGNLRVHMAALRRALGGGQSGKQYVVTIPGRGYRFVASVSSGAAPHASTLPASAPKVAHNLPASLTRMIGRADIVHALVSQLPERRFVTIVGPGGIGKTTVAVAVADEASKSYRDSVRFIDLSPVADSLHVTGAVASVLGVAVRSENPLHELVAFLKDKQMLLVLDSCEHVIEATASLAEAVLRAAPGVHILATSREAMRAEGERVQRLGPLAFPDGSDGLTAAEALAHPAVQLFVERSTATLNAFELTDADILTIAEICRRLDGIALAIELAAGQVDTFGVKGIAEHLDDHFRLLRRGRRTALPRHQTLNATLDWSYEFLSEAERLVLRRLAVLAGGFTLEAARAIAGGPDIDSRAVDDHVANLVGKSLVTADVGGTVVYYRLLDTTRVYAFDKLKEAGETDVLARRHAEYFRGLFERAETEWETRPTMDWLADYGRHIDNLRAALNWAFSPTGDAALAIAMTVAAVPLWFRVSLINECRERVERALAALAVHPGDHGRRELKLQAALGWSLMYTTGRERPTAAAWQSALRLAEDFGDIDYQLRALWGLWASHYNNGEFPQMLAFAKRFCAVAPNSTDPADQQIGDRLIGVALHFLGDQTGARRHIDRMLSRYSRPVHRSHIVRFQFEQRVTARITLARVLWLQGFADQALSAIERNVEEAIAVEHALSLCNVLANSACPVALLAGDLAAAERHTEMLLRETEQHALDIWRAYAEMFRGELLVRRGDLDSGLILLQTALGKIRNARFAQYQSAFLGVLAESLARAGRLEEGYAAVEEALLRCGETEERWCVPELLRIKGEIVLSSAAPDAVVSAEQEFLKALADARAQEALSWELRSATSLARLWRRQGRDGDAHDQLASVYGRFTEGLGTSDLQAAKQILDELADGSGGRN